MAADEDKVALIDLDGTVADYDAAMRREMRKIQGPNEDPYQHRFPESEEPPFMEARRKMIQRLPGFWRNLARLPDGFDVLSIMRETGFVLHVLTKGPKSSPNAWSEKVEWCTEHLPDANITISGLKSLVYGRVLFDDFPPYFEGWLAVRPRGLVICLAHPWNTDFAPGGSKAHPNVIRYTGTSADLVEIRRRLTNAYEREPLRAS